MKTSPTNAEEFFYEFAGVSYHPATETPEQGRKNGAVALATAEASASRLGYSFHWDLDELDSTEWSDESPAWSQWQCLARNLSGEVIGSLGCVDFGRNGDPWSDPYRRVVEAELAIESIH